MSNIKAMSCYAVLNSGIYDENFMQAHMRLVLNVVKKHYIKQSIKIKPLVTLFEEENGYAIPYFPMKKILGMATEQGYLSKKHNALAYYVEEKIVDLPDMDSQIADAVDNFNKLAIDFSFFSNKEFQYAISVEKSKQVIEEFINAQKLNLITEQMQGDLFARKNDYVFSAYVQHLHESKSNLYDYLLKCCVGSILADCMLYDEELEHTDILKNLTVVIDTPIIFRLLGVDEAKDIRQEYYVDLVQTLVQSGAKVRIFRHTYDEIQKIINSSINWVDVNYYYDPQQASLTTEFFKANHYSKTDVEAFSDCLPQKLKEFGIEILDVDFNSNLVKFHPDENELIKLIGDSYKLREIDNRYGTIAYDAQSIANIYTLREGSASVRIPDVRYIFISCNSSLVRVANDFHIKNDLEENRTLPAIISDVFLGTYIWLSNPIKIRQMNQMIVMARSFAAFEPSQQMVKMLTNSANKMLTEGKIDKDTCYLLKSSKLVRAKVMRKTLGDESDFNDDTISEILEEIQNDAYEQGYNTAKKEERNKYNLELENERNARIKNTQLVKDILNNDRHKIEGSLKKLKNDRARIEKIRRNLKRIIGLLILFFTIGLILSQICSRFCHIDATKVLQICSIADFIILCATVGIGLFIERELNLRDLLSFWPDLLCNYLIRKHECDDMTISGMENELENIDKKIQEIDEQCV